MKANVGHRSRVLRCVAALAAGCSVAGCAASRAPGASMRALRVSPEWRTSASATAPVEGRLAEAPTGERGLH